MHATHWRLGGGHLRRVCRAGSAWGSAHRYAVGDVRLVHCVPTHIVQEIAPMQRTWPTCA